MSNIKAVIFDCFGVVINYGFTSVYKSLGGTEDDQDFLHNTFVSYNRGYLNDEQFLEHVGDHFGVSPKEVQKRFSMVELQNEEVIKLILKLKKNYKTALLTNIGHGGVDRYFSKKQQQEFFDAIIVSGEVGFIKPEPEIYQIAAKKLKTDTENCVFIDDGEANCQGANFVGMQAICFKGVHQLEEELKNIGINY